MRHVAAALVLLACSSSPITVPPGDVRQISWEARAETHVPAIVVVAIDDVDDAAGAAMRAAVTPAAVAPSFDALLRRYPDDPNPSDPASGVVQDVRVIVVHPSSGTFVSPLDDPALALSAVSVGPAEVNALSAAVASHAEEGVVPASAGYPLLAATRDVVALVARERAPRDGREAALVASFPARWTTINPAFVTARDDASPGDVGAFAPPASESADAVVYVGAVPCGVTFPRLEAWTAAAAHDMVFADLAEVGCAWSPTEVPLVDMGTDDIWCLAPPAAASVARAASGSAECVVTFDSDATTCDASRGWADPMAVDGTRKPVGVEVDGQSLRRCEILQLDGAARASCETTLACSGCGPGVCFPPSQGRDPSGCPPFVRFVGGAEPGDGLLQFTCNLSP